MSPKATVSAIIVAAMIFPALYGCSVSQEPQASPSPTVDSTEAPVIPLTVDQVESDPDLRESARLDQESRESRLGDDVTLPPYSVVEFVTLESWPAVIADCMTAAGHPTEVTANGGITSVVDEDHKLEHDLAMYVCGSEYPVDPRFSAR